MLSRRTLRSVRQLTFETLACGWREWYARRRGYFDARSRLFVGRVSARSISRSEFRNAAAPQPGSQPKTMDSAERPSGCAVRTACVVAPPRGEDRLCAEDVCRAEDRSPTMRGGPTAGPAPGGPVRDAAAGTKGNAAQPHCRSAGAAVQRSRERAQVVAPVRT